MTLFWAPFVTLLFGVAGTVLVSRYYFRRSIGKSLTPYIQFWSSPLAEIAPEVARELEVRYQGQFIADLFEIQFLIANSGDRAIRNIIEPLTLTVPDEVKLLDATILHVDPEGRRVDLKVHESHQKVAFEFPLLNSGEFFIAKLLLNGNARPSAFQFSIAAEDLPPRITPKYLAPSSVSVSGTPKFEPALLGMAMAILVMGIGIAKVVYDGVMVLPPIRDVGFVGLVRNLSSGDWALLATIPAGLLLIIVGTMAFFAALLGGSFPPPRNQFVLPESKRALARTFFPHRPRSIEGSAAHDEAYANAEPLDHFVLNDGEARRATDPDEA